MIITCMERIATVNLKTTKWGTSPTEDRTLVPDSTRNSSAFKATLCSISFSSWTAWTMTIQTSSWEWESTLAMTITMMMGRIRMEHNPEDVSNLSSSTSNWSLSQTRSKKKTKPRNSNRTKSIMQVRQPCKVSDWLASSTVTIVKTLRDSSLSQMLRDVVLSSQLTEWCSELERENWLAVSPKVTLRRPN